RVEHGEAAREKRLFRIPFAPGKDHEGVAAEPERMRERADGVLADFAALDRYEVGDGYVGLFGEGSVRQLVTALGFADDVGEIVLERDAGHAPISLAEFAR